jgi:hypothetical protein
MEDVFVALCAESVRRDVMDQVIDQFTKEIRVIRPDNSQFLAVVDGEERLEAGRTSYWLTLRWDESIVTETSDEGFFDALRKVRLHLDRNSLLLCCFGASEDVYPSPMQESMGPALQAYRTRLGHQALLRDLVDIFASDESIRPSTVEQQGRFHRKWLDSLRRK